jgi:hypothetical protein
MRRGCANKTAGGQSKASSAWLSDLMILWPILALMTLMAMAAVWWPLARRQTSVLFERANAADPAAANARTALAGNNDSLRRIGELTKELGLDG